MFKVGLRVLAAAMATAFAPSQAADGISGDVVKIGVLGDMSGMYSSGFSGPGAVAAVKMAVEDFGGSVLGNKVGGSTGAAIGAGLGGAAGGAVGSSLADDKDHHDSGHKHKHKRRHKHRD